VKGLTDEERVCVETWRDIEFDTGADVCSRMLARGLIVVVNDKGEGSDPDYWYETFEATPAGLLALRLDAAARALSGVSA
jgi:hypothetical protein